MGSYASIFYYDSNNQCKFAAIFDHKFYGYIEDEEIEKTESYKYLFQLDNIPVEIINDSYCGQVCVLRKEEALKFMELYSKDYCTFQECEQFGIFHGWDRKIDNLPEDITLYLCFD